MWATENRALFCFLFELGSLILSLKKELLLPINLERVIKAMSEQYIVHHSTVRENLHNWKTFKATANLPRNGCSSKFNPRSKSAISHRKSKKSKNYSSDSTHLSMINVQVHKGAIRKILIKYGLFWEGCQGNPLFSKRNIAGCLKITKFHPKKPQDFWNNPLDRGDRSEDFWP